MITIKKGRRMKFENYEQFKQALENKNPDGSDDIRLSYAVQEVPIEWCERILEAAE
jgi:hypothetical protein